VITTLNSLFETPPSARLRVITIILLAVVWAGLTFAISVNSIALLFAVLTMMLYLLAPWTSINLIDYFFVRRGRYAITQFFVPHGIYGAWGVRGLTAYMVGFVAALPFFVLPDVYMGPAARALGGVDLGWLVGLVVSGALYLWLSHSFDPASEAGAISDSERLLAAAAGSGGSGRP
jgi:purine-cytosine permease-like protein